MQHSRFRPATPEDHPLLAAVGRETFIETYLPLHEDPSPVFAYAIQAYSVERLRSEWEKGDRGYWLLEVDGQCAGFCKLRYAPRPPMLPSLPAVELQRIYLRKVFQGKGWGAKLLGHASQLAWNEGFRLLWLGVWPENRPAVRFYLRQGFRPWGVINFYLGERVEQDTLMAKLL